MTGSDRAELERLAANVAGIADAMLAMGQIIASLTEICGKLHARIVTLEHANGYATFPQPTETEPPPIPPRPYEPDRMP